MYLCYIDESGEPELGHGTSHFVLVGLSIEAWDWKRQDQAVAALKDRFGLSNAEVHTGWMTRRYIEQEKIRLAIAQKIYDLRTKANLTQKELAHRIGTRQSVISRLEDADYDGYTLKILEKIAEAVNCHIKVDFVPQDEQYACTS